MNIRCILSGIYHSFRPVVIKGENNILCNRSKIGSGFRILIEGDNNNINIGKECLLTNTQIMMHGNNNSIYIDDRVRFMGPCKIIMEGTSSLVIKYNAGIRGVEFNLKGANIEVGELCMFSYGITLRNHDSHKIINPVDGSIMNSPKDIVLGKHVWVAQNATILKGCHIGENSVIGFGSIVTRSCDSGTIMTGIPAKVVKENINWDY